jgi:NAD(P)-dependent dehydrogenase (short-subunit alcohol dehydrogenase family)
VLGIAKGQKAAKQLADEGVEDVIFCQLDVSYAKHINRVADQIEQNFGHLDVLVNNVAVLYDYRQNAVDVDLNVVNQVLATNLFAPWRLC